MKTCLLSIAAIVCMVVSAVLSWMVIGIVGVLFAGAAAYSLE